MIISIIIRLRDFISDKRPRDDGGFIGFQTTRVCAMTS